MVKGKRWKKGQSSSSNPKYRKYRTAASLINPFITRVDSKAANAIEGKSQLTKEALDKLDSASVIFKQNINIGDDDDDDTQTVDTFKSWASNLSNCTNATFNRVHKYWKSNSALHKEILAVLAAVTEVIKANNGTENEVEYFAALMTGIESVMDNPNSVTAFLYLIALAIKKVPSVVLKVKFDELSKVYIDILHKYIDKHNTTLTKSCLMCLCWLIKEQDKSQWQHNDDKLMKSFNLMLEFLRHPKAKIRKCSQDAVKLIIASCSASNITNLTANFCLKTIEETGNNAENTAQIMHMLVFIKQIINEFSLNSLKSIFEYLFRLLAFNNIIIRSSCFQIFYQLFTSETIRHLTADLNAQLVNAFYDYQPSENDPQQLIAWLAVMQTAFTCLNKLNSDICVMHLPRIINICMCTLSSYHKQIHQVSTSVVKVLLNKCVKDNIDMLISDLTKQSDMEKSLLRRIFSSIESGLNYEYHNSWSYVIQILAAAFTAFNHSSAFVIVKNCLGSLASLRDSDQFSYKSEADYAISKSIKTFGPQLVLDAIKLNITGDEETYEYARSWLLPLLSESIENTELGFFIRYFMPLSGKLKAKSLEFKESNKQVEFKIFDTLQNQIWSLFPRFCIQPTDLNESFKSIAKYLGDLLDKSIDLRGHALHGIRNLIIKNEDNNKETMAKYSKNYLPILFNIYLTDKRIEKDPLRQLLFETIKSYLKITDLKLVNEFLQRSLEKYKMATSDDYTKYSLLDLMAIIVPYTTYSQLNVVYKLALDGIHSQLDKTIQKKSYKILDTIIESGKQVDGHPTDAIKTFMNENFENLSNSLVSTLANCNAAAKPPRLKCILHLLDYITNKDFLRKILPEIIMCVKEVNHKSRETSYLLINTMAKTWLKLSTINGGQNEPDALYDYIHFVMVGFAGSKAMISCSCLALAKLVNEFREHITGKLIHELIEAACLLLTKSNEKDIVLSSLDLMRQLFNIFNDTVLQQYLSEILQAIVRFNEVLRANQKLDSQRVRKAIKVLIKKLIKKFSYEIVYERTMALIEPNKHTLKREFHKQLAYLKKFIEKEKKAKAKKDDETKSSTKDIDLISVYTKQNMPDDTNKTTIAEIESILDDSDDDDDGDKRRARTKAVKKSTKTKSWLKEGSDNDEPLDLLDPMAIKSVFATKPLTKDEQLTMNKNKSKTMNRGFKLNNDGKLLINEDDNDDDDDDDGDDEQDIIDNKSLKAKKKENRLKKEKSADLDDLMDTLSLSKKSTISKKSSNAKSKAADDIDDNRIDNFAYKTGGTGIHRNTNAQSKQISFGQEYSSKKARGDIKRPGRPDPYAYIPLNINKLNRRKKAKLEGEYKGLVKAARRGAQKGMKMRKK